MTKAKTKRDDPPTIFGVPMKVDNRQDWKLRTDFGDVFVYRYGLDKPHWTGHVDPFLGEFCLDPRSERRSAHAVARDIERSVAKAIRIARASKVKLPRGK